LEKGGKMAEPAQVKVFRFDPKVDKEPRYETYQTLYEGYTVLDVLLYIYENLDPTLSFRYGCAGGSYEQCGACPVLVNGKPALSCKRLAEEEMTIEPHPKFEVIKDLVIDPQRVKERVIKRAPAVEIIVDPGKCDGCGDCVILCPVGVYEIRKTDGKAISFPVDMESCCGLTCKQCVFFCKNNAITVTLGG
jgi:succinate dehydrogenase/fumarate reductase-like Fe-S protein